MRYKESFHRKPTGRCPDTPTEPPPHPNTYLHLSASCLRYLTRASPFPPPRTLFPSRAVRGLLPTHPAPTTPPSRRGGEKGVGERPVCSVATSGCPKRSEDGFPAGARNIPPRPVQPKPHPKPLAQPPHPTQKIKPQTVKSGACGAADGLEGGNPERARECISAWKRFPSWFKKKNPSPFSERFWKSG